MEENQTGAFWRKIRRVASIAGGAILEPALVLYYTLDDTDTPKWAKGTILGALTYFVSPADAIPDIIPGAGYSDDLVVLAGSVAAVAAYIKEEHKTRAKEQVQRILGDTKGAQKEAQDDGLWRVLSQDTAYQMQEDGFLELRTRWELQCPNGHLLHCYAEFKNLPAGISIGCPLCEAPYKVVS